MFVKFISMVEKLGFGWDLSYFIIEGLEVGGVEESVDEL